MNVDCIHDSRTLESRGNKCAGNPKKKKKNNGKSENDSQPIGNMLWLCSVLWCACVRACPHQKRCNTSCRVMREHRTQIKKDFRFYFQRQRFCVETRHSRCDIVIEIGFFGRVFVPKWTATKPFRISFSYWKRKLNHSSSTFTTTSRIMRKVGFANTTLIGCRMTMGSSPIIPSLSISRPL